MDVYFSDFDCYSESSSAEDQEDIEFMYSGQASCILSNLDETLEKIDGFLDFEREFVHGDIVCSKRDPCGQLGKVINVKKVVALENFYGKKLNDINSGKLQRMRSISMGDFVVAGPWVGKADKIVDSVTVLFDDGTKGEFSTMGEEKLIPLSLDLADDSHYPGQRVKVVPSSMFKASRWFCGTQKEQDEGTVCAVYAGSVYVNWLGCALFGSKRVPVPPSLQSSKDLTSLSCFPHSSWQLGDLCILPKSDLTESNNLHQSFQEIFVITKIATKVDVLWQDGSQSWELGSVSLGPVNSVDPHDFWPHQFVLEKGTSEDQQNRKWGVVKNVDAVEKTVKVKWGENGMEETVSAYEMIEHTDFSYCQGDVVFRLRKGHDVEDKDTCLGKIYLSCIGIVVGFEDGNIKVKWAAGFTSQVAPDEIFRVDKSEGLATTGLLHDENVEPNQEKSDHNNHALDPKEKDLADKDPLNVPRAAISFLSNIAARLFGSPDYTSLSSPSEHGPMSAFNSEKDCESSGKNLQFDIVNDCSNHHFVNAAEKGLISSQVKRGWLKKVQQEWNILMKDLPETIYVRVFEERMDLLQAAIVGAPGTPYQDGLFFFDIFFPPEYPHQPPMVHYNSGGLRVNPNLYESGKVCLSLLNTWIGTGTETWNPDQSTVLQLLLSLQALVLNEKPYFNEAGFDQQLGSAHGEKNSCSYNEYAFLVSCKSVIYTLCKPPKHFEALVEEHFRKRCVHILAACKAYLEGRRGSSTGFKIMLSKLLPKLVQAFSDKGIDCGEYVHMETMEVIS